MNYIGAHAKFQNLRTTPSGRKVIQAERRNIEEQMRSLVPCSAGKPLGPILYKQEARNSREVKFLSQYLCLLVWLLFHYLILILVLRTVDREVGFGIMLCICHEIGSKSQFWWSPFKFFLLWSCWRSIIRHQRDNQDRLYSVFVFYSFCVDFLCFLCCFRFFLREGFVGAMGPCTFSQPGGASGSFDSSWSSDLLGLYHVIIFLWAGLLLIVWFRFCLRVGWEGSLSPWWLVTTLFTCFP